LNSGHGRRIEYLKVSKPVLIALILAILFAAYTLLFTGRKRPSNLPSPVLKTATKDPQISRPSTVGQTPKMDVSTMNLAWQNDPFSLPKSVTDKKAKKQKIVLKLVAIMESKTGRYAIIGGEIVKKGDKVGDEMVAEINRDKVVLIRNNSKRILSLEDTGQ
jgi:hypothetical protein